MYVLFWHKLLILQHRCPPLLQVGIEPDFILGKFVSQPRILTRAAHWRQRFPRCRIFAGIDSIERLKGVALKPWRLFTLF